MTTATAGRCEMSKSGPGFHDGLVKSGIFKDASASDRFNHHKTSIDLLQA